MGLKKAYDELTNNPEFSSGLTISTGESIEDESGNPRLELNGNYSTINYEQGGDALTANASSYLRLRARGDTPIEFYDGGQNRVGVSYTSGNRGVLELSNTDLNFDNAELTADEEIRTAIDGTLNKYVQKIITTAHRSGDSTAFIMLFRTGSSPEFASGVLKGFRDNGASNAKIDVTVSQTDSGSLSGSLTATISGNTYEYIDIVTITYKDTEYVAVQLDDGENGANMTGGWSWEGIASDGNDALFLRDIESHSDDLGTPTPVDSSDSEQAFYTSDEGTSEYPALQLGRSGEGLYSDGDELVGVDSSGNTTTLT